MQDCMHAECGVRDKRPVRVVYAAFLDALTRHVVDDMAGRAGLQGGRFGFRSTPGMRLKFSHWDGALNDAR